MTIEERVAALEAREANVTSLLDKMVELSRETAMLLTRSITQLETLSARVGVVEAEAR